MSDLTLTWAEVHACLAAKYGKRAFDALNDLLYATIGKEAQRGQQWALNTPLPTPIAAAAPEVPPPAPASFGIKLNAAEVKRHALTAYETARKEEQ